MTTSSSDDELTREERGVEQSVELKLALHDSGEKAGIPSVALTAEMDSAAARMLLILRKAFMTFILLLLFVGDLLIQSLTLFYCVYNVYL